MKILFENIFETATLTNTYASANYPVSNLVHVFLEKRYQPLSSLTDTITATWDTNQTADCIFLGFHTMASYTINFKNSADSILLTLTSSNPETTVRRIFSELTTIRKIEILPVFSGTPAYIGGIGCDNCYNMPDFDTNYPLDIDDTTTFIESDYGQTLQTSRRTLKQYSFSFKNVELETKDEIIEKYNLVKKGKPFFISVFDQGINDILPIYAKFIDEPRVVKNYRRFDISIKLKEAR